MVHLDASVVSFGVKKTPTFGTRQSRSWLKGVTHQDGSVGFESVICREAAVEDYSTEMGRCGGYDPRSDTSHLIRKGDWHE